MQRQKTRDSKLTTFHLWFPNLFEFKGGIQVYSAFLLKALEHLYPDINYQVFLKHDRYVSPEFAFLKQTRFYFAGMLPKRLRTLGFATQLLGYGIWQHPRLAIASHLNFTPVAYWLKYLRGIPYWTIAHGVEAWNIQRPILKTALHHADLILAVSNYTRDRLLQEQHLDPAKVLLLPNTFDSDRFRIGPKPPYLLKRYRLSPNTKILLTVCRLDSQEQYKGYDRLLQALPIIIDKIPQIHYLIVGKGDDRSRIEHLIQELNLQQHVTLAGFIPDRELCDHYNLCDLFAMPSKGEGFGIVYLEALACGKPTVGGNQDGAMDALCAGKLGALVDPDDVEAIAQTAIQILQGQYPNSLVYQPEALRQQVMEIFGFERFAETLAELLEKSPLGGKE